MNALNCTPTPSEPAALARATLGRLVALGFSEPDAETLRMLGAASTRAETGAAAAALGLDPNCVCSALEFELELVALREAHNRLFGHTVRCACPPYELEYGRSEVFQQAHALADLAGFYAALGLESAGPLIERPDHIVAEWEFLAYAAQREAAALAEGAAESAAVLADVQRKFLADHAAAWMPAFLSRLDRADAGFYGRLARLARALADNWCDAFGVRTGPDWLELRPTSADDTVINCGAPDLPGGGQVELGPWMAEAGVQDPRA